MNHMDDNKVVQLQSFITQNKQKHLDNGAKPSKWEREMYHHSKEIVRLLVLYTVETYFCESDTNKRLKNISRRLRGKMKSLQDHPEIGNILNAVSANLPHMLEDVDNNAIEIWSEYLNAVIIPVEDIPPSPDPIVS